MSQNYYCPHCDNQDPIPLSEDRCPACRKELPAPNVRAASFATETEALQCRLDKAVVEATVRECAQILADFGKAAEKGKASISRPLGNIQELVTSPSTVYSNFYQQRRGKARLPEDNPFDQKRESVDAWFFPGYHTEIVFAALTLDGRGPSAYGPHGIVLKDDMIAHRATVFETNTMNFVRNHRLTLDSPLPPGYRATWPDRGRLAQAKLYHKIDSNTVPSDFPKILLEQGDQTDTAEIIEVHLYQGFTRAALERVVFGVTTCRAEELIIKSLKKKLDQLGIAHEGP